MAARNIENAGLHTACDEVTLLKRELARLEREDLTGMISPSPVAALSSPEPTGPVDTELIMAKLAMAYEERMLDLKLRAEERRVAQLEERVQCEGNEYSFRVRIADEEDNLRLGLQLLCASEFAIRTQRDKRRLYDEARLQDVQLWSQQAKEMNELDADFIKHDKARMTALIACDESERQEAEWHYRKRLEAERQLLFIDEEDLLSQQLVLERLNLVRIAPR